MKKKIIKYKIKPTKKQLKVINKYWKDLLAILDTFYGTIFQLEKAMEKETGIKGIEFFMCDNDYRGIGNWQRTMKLIRMR